MRIFNSLLIIIFCFKLYSCKENTEDKKGKHMGSTGDSPYLVVLGTIQDGGSPHPGCKKNCCKALFDNPDHTRKVVSLGIIDPRSKQTWIFEATPDFPEQIKMLKNISGFQNAETPDGIFITHAHIGHYAGLMYLGKEAMNSKNVAVYAMPKLKSFLETNGPWSQLVSMRNINLHSIEDEMQVPLNNYITVMPFTVPHRDEFSETVGFIIRGHEKKVLFIPDINKWDIWNKSIIDEIKNVDYAFIDATFYDGEEINTRNISEIPHPFITESMELFKDLPQSEKNKIYFIHFNHTNPVLDTNSEQTKGIISKGYNIATFGQKLPI